MFSEAIDRLLKGDANLVRDNVFRTNINTQVSRLLSQTSYTEEDYRIMDQLLHIGNIIYNNTDLDDNNQPIDNDAYDILLERYRMFNPNVQVGAEPVHFPSINNNPNTYEQAVSFIDWIKDIPNEEEFVYKDDIFNNRIPLPAKPFIEYGGQVTGKKYRVVSHGNPELVGTLDKCKYVLCSQAEEKGVLDDPSVKVLERDFFGVHFKKGIINPNMIFRMLLELKYDGISVVVTIKNKRVVMAVSRGDTGMDKATDLTPVLYGYFFPNLPDNLEMDVKCEAVMTYQDLYYYNIEKGYNYSNCRSAIIGLFSANEGALYQKYITLVPLAVAHSSLSGKGEELDNIDRITEVEFINKYLVSKEYLRSSYIEGDYNTILFLIKRFVDEAEVIRPLMPTMYDGIVLSYVDQNLRDTLGREDSVNKYSVAVKFNAMKKLTELLAVTFTVGQDGTITPMAHYKPINFLGTTHTKSSLASVARFNANQFKIGNIIEVEYRNDVMPYVTTPDIDHNRDNPNPIIQFITHCPECGTELVLSKTGKSAKCPNINCRARAIARIANMLDKLGIKDFAEATVDKANIGSFIEMIEYDEQTLADIIGEVNAKKYRDRMNEILTTPMYDFEIVGSLGFSGIAKETWKKIFSIYTLDDIIAFYVKGDLDLMLSNIKGIGPVTRNTIVEEMEFFFNDLCYIKEHCTIKSSTGLVQKSIRVSGFRDPELMKTLCDMGYDASDAGVTKNTDILLIPNEGYTSSKLNKVGVNTLIVPVQDFRDNMGYYLSKI